MSRAKIVLQMSLVSPDASLESDMSPAVVCLKPLYVKVEYVQ